MLNFTQSRNKIIFFLSPGEGDSWKDELLELARSKQERTTSELHCLRQVHGE